jgi:hypothetical protein
MRFIRVHGHVVPITDHRGMGAGTPAKLKGTSQGGIITNKANKIDATQRGMGIGKMVGGAALASFGGAVVGVTEAEARFRQSQGKQLFSKGYNSLKQFALAEKPVHSFALNHAETQVAMGAFHKAKGTFFRKSGKLAGIALLSGGAGLLAKGLTETFSKSEKNHVGLNKANIIGFGAGSAVAIGSFKYSQATGDAFIKSANAIKGLVKEGNWLSHLKPLAKIIK